MRAGEALAALKTHLAKRGFGDPILWPRSPGSWPGYAFTSPPFELPAVQFGLGRGSGAHAPNEYYLIESANPRIAGLAGAVCSQVEDLYELATMTT